jgi:hypothetical protein
LAEPSLKALPGRVILKFPKPAEKSAGGILLPQTSQLRPEFGEIHDVGDGITEEEKAAAGRFRELQAKGVRIPVTYAAGVGYWREEYTQAGLDKGEWGWLRDFRVYRLTEIAAFVDEARRPVETDPED